MTDAALSTAPFCGDDHDTALPPAIAQQRILDAIAPLDAGAVERLELRLALGRVLAEAVAAPADVPPHANSAMDGYALSGGDLPEAGLRELRVAGASFAGHPFSGACDAGECVQIMTGAVLPEGADTVVPQEHVERLDAAIRIDGRTRAGANVRPAGDDIQQGETVLAQGRRLTAADIGVLASLGIAQVAVRRRLRVAFFSTGDELRSLGEALGPGQIYDSNRYALHALLERQLCDITDLGVVRDDPPALRAALSKASQGHDVVLTSGGVSVGEADYVRQVLGELGEMHFWKVAMKPGRPLTFGHLGPALFFGLPGNPVAMMVGFSQFVLPALRRLAGETAAPPLALRAVSLSALKKQPGRTEYQRGILASGEDGSLTVRLTGHQGSGALTSMSRANCFIVLPPGQTQVEPGAEVLVQPFADWL
jgi:molybdopterin molybdotransferase